MNLPKLHEINKEKPNRPIKVLQFGEGNFLRGFVDYMIDILNEKCGFNGNIVIVKPIEYGDIKFFEEQNSVYTVLLRGLCDGSEYTEKRIINSVEKVISCYDDYKAYAEYAKLDTLRFIVSNTTEAGITLKTDDKIEMSPPVSYPAKLTKFLYERYIHFNGDVNKGLVILPVELIDDNGKELKRIVKELCKIWNLEEAFIKWLDNACVFSSTLVDRIVTGYPFEEADKIAEELGYSDNLIVTAEPFALWVIESEKDISGELDFEKANLPVIFTDNQAPYKKRKVRILNGAHTSFVLSAYLAGFDFVGQSMNDDIIKNFMNSTIFDEVIPTLDLPENELISFANAVIDRFRNPFIKHSLLAISLNSVSKWKARCLPSFVEYINKFNKIPLHLAFSLASLMAFYSGNEINNGALIGKRIIDTNVNEYKIQDDAVVLDFFAKNSSLDASVLTNKFLSNTAFFGIDLTAFKDAEATVAKYLDEIRTYGMKETLKNFSDFNR